MKNKALILIAMSLMSSAVSQAQAPADRLSPQLCSFLIEEARETFDRIWEESWQESDLPRIREALYAFVDRLTPLEKELIHAYEKGKASDYSMHVLLLRKSDTEEFQVPEWPRSRVILSPRNREGKWSFRAAFWKGSLVGELFDVDLSGSTLDHAAVDRYIQEQMIRRTSARLVRGGRVHNANEYIRFHNNIPDECFPGDVVPHVAQNDSNAGKAADVAAELAAQAGQSAQNAGNSAASGEKAL